MISSFLYQKVLLPLPLGGVTVLNGRHWMAFMTDSMGKKVDRRITPTTTRMTIITGSMRVVSLPMAAEDCQIPQNNSKFYLEFRHYC